MQALTVNISERLTGLVGRMALQHAQSTGANPPEFYLEYYLSLLPHLQALYPLGEGHGFAPEHRILEVGSGMGTRCLLGNAIWGCDFTGVEPCANSYSLLAEAIDEFRSVNGHLSYRSSNETGEETGLPSGHFDFVLSFEVAEHVADPERFVSELYRVLKPGGKLLLSTCSYSTFFEGHYRAPWLPFLGPRSARSWVRLLGYNPDFLEEINFITGKKLLALLKEAGFGTIRSGWTRSASPLPELRVAAPDGFDPACRNKRPSSLQKLIQRPRVHRLLSLFGLEYKIYLEAEK